MGDARAGGRRGARLPAGRCSSRGGRSGSPRCSRTIRRDAAEQLRAVWEHTLREGVDEPGAFPVAPDLVEALVELGELDEARAVTERLRELAEQQEHPWGLATAKRCGAIDRSSSPATYDEEAAAALVEAAADYDGSACASTRARSPARPRPGAAPRCGSGAPHGTSLEAAVAAFDALGSDGLGRAARAPSSPAWARAGRARAAS